MATVGWLAASLPGDFLGPLGAIGGVAMQTGAAMAGGAAAVHNALAGTAGDVAHALSAGSMLAGQATSIGHAAVGENIAHLVSGAQGIASGPLVPHTPMDAIGATPAAAVENATKLVNALGSTNPLHGNLLDKASLDSLVRAILLHTPINVLTSRGSTEAACAGRREQFRDSHACSSKSACCDRGNAEPQYWSEWASCSSSTGPSPVGCGYCDFH